MPDLFAYTDGACSGNPGPGGWGVLLLAKDGDTILREKELSGGEPETTLQLVPLTDTFDADLLEFVSASPVETTAAVTGSAPNSVGTLQWANIGPIYPGGTKQVTVTFRALEPAGNSTVEEDASGRLRPHESAEGARESSRGRRLLHLAAHRRISSSAG